MSDNSHNIVCVLHNVELEDGVEDTLSLLIRSQIRQDSLGCCFFIIDIYLPSGFYHSSITPEIGDITNYIASVSSKKIFIKQDQMKKIDINETHYVYKSVESNLYETSNRAVSALKKAEDEIIENIKKTYKTNMGDMLFYPLHKYIDKGKAVYAYARLLQRDGFNWMVRRCYYLPVEDEQNISERVFHYAERKIGMSASTCFSTRKLSDGKYYGIVYVDDRTEPNKDVGTLRREYLTKLRADLDLIESSYVIATNAIKKEFSDKRIKTISVFGKKNDAIIFKHCFYNDYENNWGVKASITLAEKVCLDIVDKLGKKIDGWKFDDLKLVEPANNFSFEFRKTDIPTYAEAEKILDNKIKSFIEKVASKNIEEER